MQAPSVLAGKLPAPVLLPPPAAPGLAAARAGPTRIATTLPAWQRFAVNATVKPDMPRIVVVLDDLGLSYARSTRAVGLPRPLTLAILPYGPEPAALASRARAAGHDIIGGMNG